MKRYWSEICAALFLAVVISCFGGVIVYASSAEQQITDQMELTDLQSMVDEMLGEKTFSVAEAFHRLLSGEEVLSEESVREFLHSLLFYGIEREKELIVKLLLLLLFAAVFSGFAGAFDNGQVGDQFLCGVSSCFYSSDEQFFRFECITAFNACVDHGVYEGTLTGVFYGSGSSVRCIQCSCFLSGSTASGVAFSMDPGTSTASRSEFIYSSEICKSSFQGRNAGKNG